MQSKCQTSTSSGKSLLMAVALAGSLLAGFAANAHQAPSGWTYPTECCDDRDCSQIDTADITVGKGFYKWKNHRISFQSPKIRRSPDSWFHGCESTWWNDTSGHLEIICFFVPTGL